MAHMFEAGESLSPWPSAIRLAGSAARAAGAALARLLPRRRGAPGGVSLPRVSTEWLRQHEISSTKHDGDV